MVTLLPVQTGAVCDHTVLVVGQMNYVQTIDADESGMLDMQEIEMYFRCQCFLAGCVYVSSLPGFLDCWAPLHMTVSCL